MEGFRGSTRIVDDKPNCALRLQYRNMNSEGQYSKPTSGPKVDAMAFILSFSAVGRLRATHTNVSLPTNAG